MTETTIKALAEHLDARVLGSDDALIESAASLDTAQPGHLSAYLSPQWRAAALTTQASAVIVGKASASDLPASVTRLVVDAPRDAWARALRVLYPRATPIKLGPGVHPSAIVEPSATIATDARVGALAYVGDNVHIGAAVQVGSGARIEDGSRIGAGSLLMPNCVVIGGSILGSDVWIGPGAVIGGFGFGLDENGRLPHVGRVQIGDRTTIGANACVDRSTIDETRIGHDCHIDNLVQIGHNVIIGHGVVICGQAGIAGGGRIGDGVVIGGQAGITGHVSVMSSSRIAAQSGVTRTLDTAGDYSGHPAEPNRERLRRMAKLKRLTEE